MEVSNDVDKAIKIGEDVANAALEFSATETYRSCTRDISAHNGEDAKSLDGGQKNGRSVGSLAKEDARKGNRFLTPLSTDASPETPNRKTPNPRYDMEFRGGKALSLMAILLICRRDIWRAAGIRWVFPGHIARVFMGRAMYQSLDTERKKKHGRCEPKQLNFDILPFPREKGSAPSPEDDASSDIGREDIAGPGRNATRVDI